MGREDIAHYESALVMTVARSFLRKNTTWDDLSTVTRRIYVERAINVLFTLFNDAEAVERLNTVVAGLRKDALGRPGHGRFNVS